MPAPDLETPAEIPAGARGGSAFLQAIEALHRAYGKDEAWLTGWWAKVCRERGVTTPEALPASSLVELHQQIRRYYERGDAETTSPTAPERSMWRETLEAHRDDSRLPAVLRSKIKLALHKDSEITETKGLELAGAVLDCLAAEDATRP
jgi:hypothetical protein